MTSQLPFGWVCYSNSPRRSPSVRAGCGLNCLSAGSVSLTRIEIAGRRGRLIVSQLPFGWVCFSNRQNTRLALAIRFLSQLPFGWVCFSNEWNFADKRKDAWGCLNCLSAGSVSLTNQGMQMQGNNGRRLNCLSAGSVSLTAAVAAKKGSLSDLVSIAFRLGLFL